ncbi:MAG: rod shape-determining protein [Planctomycetota bacterium]|nr:MAG: rod shape-determining protein [Planctomycetota bacterium]
MLGLNYIMGLLSVDMGIDLGTANTLVSVRGEGIVLNEPSVVAVRKGTNEVLMDGQAVGHAAKEMLGKCPAGIEAVRPLRRGVIADFDITEAMLAYFIAKVHNRRFGVRPRVVIGVPSGITVVEKQAVYNSAERAGARQVFLIEEPRAAGIGAGLPIQEPIAHMVVDIGGGTSDIAVTSLAEIVASRSVKVAGDTFDEAIIEHLKQVHNLHIGEQTAERIKVELGSVTPLDEEQTLEVKGRDVSVGRPRGCIIRSEEIREVLREPVKAISRSIIEVLEETPPELSADLVDTGIVLTGGGSLLRGLDAYLEEEVGLPVRVAEDPISCVAHGTAIFLEHLDRYASILESSDQL